MRRVSIILLAVLSVAGFSAPVSATSDIDIIVLYTEKVRDRSENIIGQIELVESVQNRMFLNSGIDATVRLIPELLVGVDEDADLKPEADYCPYKPEQTCILEYLINNVGNLGIEQLRAQHRADLVSVWVYREGWSTVGSAADPLDPQSLGGWDGTTVGAKGYASSGYLSVVLSEKAWLWSHFAHEIGHNLGLAHSDGYVDADYPFRTVMAYDQPCVDAGYDTCPRVPLYSNPDVSYFGRPTGSAVSNAAAVLRRTVALISLYGEALFGAP